MRGGQEDEVDAMEIAHEGLEGAGLGLLGRKRGHDDDDDDEEDDDDDEEEHVVVDGDTFHPLTRKRAKTGASTGITSSGNGSGRGHLYNNSNSHASTTFSANRQVRRR